jgi:hypothetical protein
MSGDTEMTQKVVIKAGFSFDRAEEMIRFLVLQGMSVTAKHDEGGRQWEIAATEAFSRPRIRSPGDE